MGKLSSFLKRYFPLLFIGIVLIAIISAYWTLEEKFQGFSTLIIACTTVVYAYLTYEILKHSSTNRNLPALRINYLICKINSQEYTEMKADLLRTSSFTEIEKRLLEAVQDSSADQSDLVFVKIENYGDGTAIDIKMDVTFSQKSLDNENSTNRNLDVKPLSRGEKAIIFLSEFQKPSAEDYFNPKICKVTFNDVGRIYLDKDVVTKDLSQSKILLRNQDTSIAFDCRVQ